ncbi:ubiquitin-conjugating enzyme/RWD-like protein [Yarrowia lipolytica]|nr:ubiquitin-conjugating enzyme/RWD-like protein [Yarrowia lipolytica]
MKSQPRISTVNVWFFVATSLSYLVTAAFLLFVFCVTFVSLKLTLAALAIALTSTQAQSYALKMASQKRLIKELAAYKKDPNPCLASLTADGDNLYKWTAVMRGTEGTAYENGLWQVEINIPENYPLQPPTMFFRTKICHPNIHFETGEVCIDVLKTQWSPAWTISSACTAVSAMLSLPEPDSPLNIDAANLVRCGDESAMEGLVRYYVNKYASGN